MINTHKEFIAEIENFATKMELINDFKYIKDVDNLSKELGNSEPRVLILGLQSINFDDENYNLNVSYKFVISDSCKYDDGSVLNSETENMFIVSALKDYLNYITEVDIELEQVEMTTESDNEATYTSAVGNFTILIKRSPSYWKKMEAYSTP